MHSYCIDKAFVAFRGRPLFRFFHLTVRARVGVGEERVILTHPHPHPQIVLEHTRRRRVRIHA
jgi:hypothetical protein